MPSQNYDDYQNDSSNWAHDGANGHEGLPEMLQRLRKEEEQRIAREKMVAKNIIRTLYDTNL